MNNRWRMSGLRDLTSLRAELIALAAVISLITPVEAQSTSVEDDVSEIISASYDDYFSGNVTESIKQLTSTLERQAPTLSNDERVSLRQALVDICLVAYDFSCISDHAGELATELMAIPYERAAVGRSLQLEAQYYVALLSLVVNTPENARKTLSGLLQQEDEGQYNQDYFIRRQILAAQLHMMLDDRVAVRRSVDRALAALLSTKNPQEFRWNVATGLVQCLRLLTTIGESDRARGLLLQAGDYLAQSFPATSIEFVQYRVVEAEILQQIGDLEGSKGAAASAQASLDSIKLPDRIRFIWEYQIAIQGAMACVLSGDIKAADQWLDALDRIVGVQKLRKTREWIWQGQLLAVATRVLHNTLQMKPSDDRDVALLRQKAEFVAESPYPELFDLYQRMALLLAEGSFLRGETPAQLREVARDYVTWIRNRARHSFDVFPRPGNVDQSIATLLLMLLANAGEMQPGDVDLVIALADIATRSSRAFDSEAQALLGMVRTADERRLLHQGLRLSARRNELERHELARLVSTGTGEQPGSGYMDVDFYRRSALMDFAVEIDRIRVHLETSAPELNSNPLLPTESEIRSALRDDEAFVWLVPTGGIHLGMVCVSKTAAQVRFQTLDMDQVQTDIRLLSLSLSASHPPNEALDKQFPAEASVRLYQGLVAPVESCLSGVRTLLWSVDLATVPVPVAALLRSAPTAVPGGYDLESADWLVRHYAIAYVRTPAALVSLRRRRHDVEDLPFRFLGVGDPVLTDPAVLAPLPETRDELNASAAAVGNPATVLVGEHATEGQFRRTPISQFRYMSFATHALIREELPGISEAAIVLTPGSQPDRQDDGLLKASEIADMRLNADFVALSACNTANVDLDLFASNMPGLATAFAVAGVPSTLATLWAVDSESSKAIVETVFANLMTQPENGPAIALAHAQKALIEQRSLKGRMHPRFWAAFVVFGDSVGSTGTPHSRTMHVSDIQPLTKNGGEMLGVASTRTGQLVVSGYGEWNGTRFDALLYEIGPDKGVAWQLVDHELGAGGVVVNVERGVVSADFLWGGKDNPVSSIVVRLLTHEGKVLRRTLLPTEGHSSFPASALVTDAGEVILTVAENAREDTGSGQARRITLFRLSQDLEMLARRSIEIPASTDTLSAELTAAGDRYVLTVADDYFIDPTDEHTDIMLNRKFCLPTAQTWIRELDASTLNEISAASIPGAAIRALAGGSAATVGVGYVAGCDGRRQLTAWEVGGGGARMIYQEPAVLESSGAGVTRLSDGGIVITGGVTRVTDIRRAKGDDPVSNADESSQTKLSFSEQKTQDLIVVRLDARNQVADRRIVAFGADVSATAPIVMGDELVIAGSVGNQGALISMKLPALTPQPN